MLPTINIRWLVFFCPKRGGFDDRYEACKKENKTALWSKREIFGPDRKIAYENGLRHGDCTGNLKKWVDSLYFKERTANQIRLYSDKAYIFTGDKLITVIQIPHNLVKEVDKLRRSKQQYDAEVKFEKNEKGTL